MICDCVYFELTVCVRVCEHACECVSTCLIKLWCGIHEDATYQDWTTDQEYMKHNTHSDILHSNRLLC